MLQTTTNAVREILRADPTVTTNERTRLLALLRGGTQTAEPGAVSVARIIRRSEAAARLGVSPRSIDNYSRAGLLTRRILPGRTRANGFLESDVAALVVGGAA